MEASLISGSEVELQTVIYGRLSTRPQPQQQIRGESHGPGDSRKRRFEAASAPTARVAVANEETHNEAEQRGPLMAETTLEEAPAEDGIRWLKREARAAWRERPEREAMHDDDSDERRSTSRSGQGVQFVAVLANPCLFL